MVRWYWKRWVWSVVAGSTAMIGMSAAQPGGTDAPPAVPRVGDVITLKFRDGPDRQVKVLKTEKQPDGSYHSEVKDTKTGETFTLVDRPGDALPPPAGATGKTSPAAAGKPTDPAKAKTGPNDPLIPPLGKIFRDKDTSKDGRTTAAKPTVATPEPEPEKPGLLKRLFGRKQPTPPPAVTVPASTAGKSKGNTGPSGTSSPPPVRPTPATTAEPPLVQPSRPIAPPTPAVPAPVAIPPAPASSAPAPAPLPLPTIPPATPTPPGGLPTIPLPPGGVSTARPPGDVVPTRATVSPTPAALAAPAPSAPDPAPMRPPLLDPTGSPAASALVREIQPHVTALQTGTSPTQRIIAARALAGGRHGSSDTVKAVLLIAATNDPNPAVRVCCIEELVSLGYYDPQFMSLLHQASTDPSREVREAAAAALKKMTPRK